LSNLVKDSVCSTTGFLAQNARATAGRSRERTVLHESASGTWHHAARVTDLEPGDAIAVSINDRDIALFRVGTEFFATDNRCTHAAAPLADGYLDGEVIECPLHQGLFNVRTGVALCTPALRPVRTYPVRLVDGRVEIRL